MAVRLSLAASLCLVGLILAALAFARPFGAVAIADIGTLAVDTNTSGNTATTLGPIDNCISVTNGTIFNIDIVVDAVPSFDNPASGFDRTGLAGFGFDLVYDKTVLTVTGKNASFLLASNPAGYMPFSVTNSVPNSSGDFNVGELDLSQHYDSGPGVLERLTLQAIGVGNSELAIDGDPQRLFNPQVLASDSSPDSIGSILNGSVNVASGPPGTCVPVTSSPTPLPTSPPTPAPTPTPTPIPTATSIPTPTIAPAGIGTLAVDTDTTGNTASGQPVPHTETLGAIDPCRTVANGTTFDIDVGVDAVPTWSGNFPLDHTGLSGFAFDLVYDPTVLKVTGKDDAFLLASGGTGFTPFSFTNSVPNSTGDFSVNEADLSINYDSGGGVLERITLQAIGLGNSQLAIDGDPLSQGNPVVLASDSSTYTVGTVQNGSIDVTATGVEPCVLTSSPTPVPTPTLGPFSPTLTIGSAAVPPGANVTVDVSTMAPAPGIAAYNIDVSYDNNLIGGILCTSNPAGVCNASFNSNTMRFVGATFPGLVGNVTLGSLTFVAGNSPGQCSALTIKVVQLVDANGFPLGAAVSNGQICIEVGRATSTPTAAPTSTVTRTPKPTACPIQRDSDGRQNRYAKWYSLSYFWNRSFVSGRDDDKFNCPSPGSVTPTPSPCLLSRGRKGEHDRCGQRHRSPTPTLCIDFSRNTTCAP